MDYPATSNREAGSPFRRHAGRWLLLIAASSVLFGCGGGDASTTAAGPGQAQSNPVPVPANTSNTIRVTNVNGGPIEGAMVEVVIGGTRIEAATAADGIARFPATLTGAAAIAVRAAGFETFEFTSRFPASANTLSLRAVGAWAIGRASVLAARMLERAADGSTLTFSVDVAVVDGDRRPISHLTQADFSIPAIDCGWGGPRDCATDADGRAPATGGYFQPERTALSFGLQPSAARRPYLVSLLVDRYEGTAAGAGARTAAAIKSYLSTLGAADAVSLSTVDIVNGAPVLNTLGPVTGNGNSYFNIIDQMTWLEWTNYSIAASIEESIRRVAIASSTAAGNPQPVVLVWGDRGLEVSEFRALALLAQQSGVRFSVVTTGWRYYGLTELAMRSGGFIAQYDDPRQLDILAGVLDPLLAGSMPYYRMTFRLNGAGGTFAPGGNVKAWLDVRIPASMPNRGASVQFDIPIP